MLQNCVLTTVSHLKKMIVDLERHGVCMLYIDVKPGGHLDGSAEYFTFFSDFNCGDAFLDVVNYTDGCEPGQDLCENNV